MRTTIKSGLPCLARLTHISGRYLPAIVNREPDYCHEAEYPEVEFELLTLAGKPAPWLYKAASEADLARIESELLNQQQEY